MLVPGTQMHWVTFCFICIEVLILFYLLIHRLAVPEDRTSILDIFLILLLIVYNLTGGLLPDPQLPGSYFIQNSIAYATGFMTPCYFPFYIHKGFGLDKMHFHAYRGVFFFLIGPYLLFVIVFAITGNLSQAKDILIIPVLYAVWVVISLGKAIRIKYPNGFGSHASRVEIIVLFFSLLPWVSLPFIAYFNLSQTVEATVTNMGFLLLLALHMKRNVEQIKSNHQKLIESEQQLSNYDARVEKEVEKRTTELALMSKEEHFNANCELYRLTKREIEISTLVCKGKTNRQIGDNLFISEKTVATHVQNILEKVRVANRLELCQKMERTSTS